MDEYGAAAKNSKIWMMQEKYLDFLLIYLSVPESLGSKKNTLFGIRDWRECVISQHMTQTWEPALTGEDKKKLSSQLL